MTHASEKIDKTLTFKRGVWTVIWIFIKLALLTAMLNNNAAEFIYAGF